MTIQHTYEGATYRWCLRREDIDGVLHYTHWIPNARGFTQSFFASKYPGETLNGFMSAFAAAGVLTREGPVSFSGRRCHWCVRHLYFTDKHHWAVEWDDNVTADDGRFFYAGDRNPCTTGTGAVTVPVDELLGADGEPSADKMRNVLNRLGPG
jgi:hypothetical protein